jgi:hypothetical protein
VPPPPVSGASAGGGGDTTWCADGVLAECADPEAEADVRVVPDAGADVRGVPDAAALAVAELPDDRVPDDPLPADGLVVAECVAEDPPLAGDGVLVPGWVADPDDDVSGVGVKVDGTEEPPAVQAETATASRTAPAARRPAAGHASLVAAGVLSRIFMDPPRTRVRYTR